MSSLDRLHLATHKAPHSLVKSETENIYFRLERWMFVRCVVLIIGYFSGSFGFLGSFEVRSGKNSKLKGKKQVLDAIPSARAAAHNKKNKKKALNDCHRKEKQN